LRGTQHEVQRAQPLPGGRGIGHVAVDDDNLHLSCSPPDCCRRQLGFASPFVMQKHRQQKSTRLKCLTVLARCDVLVGGRYSAETLLFLRKGDMGEKTEFRWPADEAECVALARSMLLAECVGNVRYWLAHGSDLVTRAEPQTAFQRPWSALAKRDRSYREMFATLDESQKAKVLELLENCISGAVFSTLCTLDQFPYGEAELFIWDGVCGEGKRRFRIAPDAIDLHDDFAAALQSTGPTDGTAGWEDAAHAEDES
jgi:hypothetical protein